MNPAVNVAVSVLFSAAELMRQAREANELIDGLGEGLHPKVVEARRLLKAEWQFSADLFQRDIEAELDRRGDEE